MRLPTPKVMHLLQPIPPPFSCWVNSWVLVTALWKERWYHSVRLPQGQWSCTQRQAGVLDIQRFLVFAVQLS